MEQKMQLKHPQGKKTVSIDTDKYELLKDQIIEFLTNKTAGTFTDILKAITQELNDKNIKFDGSLNWYLEWVKLDLEAQEIIQRIDKITPQKYQLKKQDK